MTSSRIQFVLSIMSRDRVGIVYEVSTAISELEGDIADLRQSVLRGYFTMILLASFPATVTEETIRRRLKALDLSGAPSLEIAVSRADEVALNNGRHTFEEAGEFVAFGGLFGESAILPVRSAGQSSRLIAFGGRIPAPVHSLKN